MTAVVGPPSLQDLKLVATIQADSSGTTIPDAEILFNADYSRLGDDLLLRMPDGQAILVEDYFALDSPPALWSLTGARLTGEMVETLAGGRAPGLYAQLSPGGGEAPIGSVGDLVGSAQATRADGSVAVLQEGDPVFQGDILQTGSGSTIALTFNDGTVFSLSGNGRIVLDQFIYNPAQASGNAMGVSLIQGAFAFVTGQVAPTGGVEIKTPVGNIGIRGSDAVGSFDAGTETFTFIYGSGNIVFDGHVFTLPGETLTKTGVLGEQQISSTSPEDVQDAFGDVIGSAENAGATFSPTLQSGDSGQDPSQEQGGEADPEGDPEADTTAGEIEGAPDQAAEAQTGAEGEEGETEAADASEDSEPIETGAGPEGGADPIETGAGPEGGGQPLSQGGSIDGNTPSLASVGAPTTDFNAGVGPTGNGGAPSPGVTNLSPPGEEGDGDEDIDVAGDPGNDDPPIIPPSDPNDGIQLTGTGADDVLTGFAGPDQINGAGGNDQITGAGGDDMVDGGPGNDAFIYLVGDGNDTVTGGPGTDILAVGGDGGGNAFNISAQPGDSSLTLNADGASVTVSGVEDLLVAGGGGDDSLTVSGDLDAAGVSQNTIFFSGGAGDDVADASGLVSPQRLVATGDAGNDTLTGGLADDSLSGDGGNDILVGNGGNDVLLGGAGNDTLTGGAGNDEIDGGEGGEDVAVFSGNLADYTITADGDEIFITDNVGGDGTDSISGVEILQFADQSVGANLVPVVDGQDFAVNENQPAGTVIGSVDATDPNANALTFSIIGGNAGGLFAIDPVSGELSTTGTLDHEAAAQHILTIQVTDNGVPPASASADVTININDVNEDPAIADQDFFVAEGAGPITVGTLAAGDPDNAGEPFGTLTFAITGGNDDGLFTIDAATGEIATTGSLDHEVVAQRVLTVSVTDGGGLSDDATVTINITDQNEAPSAPDFAASVDENLPAGTVVGSIAASDPDDPSEPFGTLTFDITGGNGQGLFAIDQNGEITTTAPLDFEAADQHVLTVTVTDGGGLEATASVTVTVNDLSDGLAPPTIDEVTDDTGAADDDGLTSDNTLFFSGTAAVGTTVEVFLDGASLGTTTTGNDGVWVFDHTGTALPDGDFTVTARASDNLGNSSLLSDPFALTLDTTAPLPPVITGIADDTGSPFDGITSDNDLLVSGTALPGSTVQLTLNGNDLGGPVQADGAGNWSIQTGVIGDGIHFLRATATDLAGNVSGPSFPFPITIDTAPPPAPIIEGVTDDTGTPDDGITSDNTLEIFGTAEADATVQVFIDGLSIGSTTANFVGDWTFDHTGTVLPDGSYEVTAQAVDAAGNVSPASAIFDLTVNTSGPDAPIIDGVTVDSGVAGDGVTNDNTPLISGSAEAGATVDVFRGGGLLGTTTADGNGNWSFLSPALPEGTSPITAVATDAQGNPSPESAPFDLTIDTAAPAVPVIVSIADDSGVPGDGVTNDNDLLVSGTAEAGATVQLLLGGDPLGSPVQADGSGNWSVQTGILPDGPHDLTATATDLAGNASGPSDNFPITIDTASPPAPVITGFSDDTGTPGDGLTGDNDLLVSGRGQSGATIQLFLDGSPIGSLVAVDGDGDWSVQTGVIADGLHSFTAVASDQAGNDSGPSDALDVTIDAAAPGAPIIEGITVDSGLSGDGVTNDNTIFIFGTAEAGSIGRSLHRRRRRWARQLCTDGVGRLVLRPHGLRTWRMVQLMSSPPGRPTPAANESPDSDDFNLTIDTVSPARTRDHRHHGRHRHARRPHYTTDDTLVISGTAEAGSRGGGLPGRRIPGNDDRRRCTGAWSFDNTASPIAIGRPQFDGGGERSGGQQPPVLRRPSISRFSDPPIPAPIITGHRR